MRISTFAVLSVIAMTVFCNSQLIAGHHPDERKQIAGEEASVASGSETGGDVRLIPQSNYDMKAGLQSDAVRHPLAPPVKWPEPYAIALRTNLLHWAMATSNIGVEWRVTRKFGMKVDGGRTGQWKWDGENRVFKVWYVNPEIRWYMCDARRFYMGLGGTYGHFNVKLGSTGYQGDFYGGGLTIGYQMKLARRLSMDFNLGLGYTRYEYDSFTVIDNVRVYERRDLTRNWYGPTQVGISLFWRFGVCRY